MLQSSEKLKVDLVIEMEAIDEIHPVLSEVIMEAAMLAIDSLLSQVCYTPLQWVSYYDMVIHCSRTSTKQWMLTSLLLWNHLVLENY